MLTVTVTLDDGTEFRLRQISATEGEDMDKVAARLLKRAVLAARERPVYDLEAIRANCQEFAPEDESLAESDLIHRADLLAQEDAA